MFMSHVALTIDLFLNYSSLKAWISICLTRLAIHLSTMPPNLEILTSVVTWWLLIASLEAAIPLDNHLMTLPKVTLCVNFFSLCSSKKKPSIQMPLLNRINHRIHLPWADDHKSLPMWRLLLCSPLPREEAAETFPRTVRKSTTSTGNSQDITCKTVTWLILVWKTTRARSQTLLRPLLLLSSM